MKYKYKCCICSRGMDTFKFAIRDVKAYEHPLRWFWRHLSGLLMFGYLHRDRYKLILPICNICKEECELRDENKIK